MQNASPPSMKTLNTFAVASVLLSSFMLGGCSDSPKEVAHSESDKPNWTNNGSTHNEETTYKNADGTTSTESSKSVTNK
jgi:hypothetical protein